MKPSTFLTTHGDEWILYEEHKKIVEQVRDEERKRSDLYMQGYADGRTDAKELSEINATVYYNYGYDDGYSAALRDAVGAVKALPWSHNNWMSVDERAQAIAAIEGLEISNDTL